MENLLNLGFSRAFYPLLIFLIGYAFLAFDFLQKRNIGNCKSKNRKKAHKTQRKICTHLSCEVVAFFLAIVIFIGTALLLSGNYLFDAWEDNPITVNGTVDDVRFTSYGRHMDVYQVIVHTDQNETLVLEISCSLYENYSIVSGERYCVEYYPRTKALSSIIPVR